MEPLTGIFLAGAIVCGVGLVRTLLGYPVTWAELWLFFGVACSYTAWRWHQRLAAWVRLEELRNDERALAVERQRRALEQAATLPAIPPQQAATLAQQDASIRAHHWRQAIHRFLTAGDKHGFGVRVMAAKTSPHKVIAWNAWGEVVRVLRDAGILVGAGDGTKWAPEWDYHRWLELKDTLSIPCPKGEPPDVILSVSNTNTPKRNSEAGRAVIEQ